LLFCALESLTNGARLIELAGQGRIIRAQASGDLVQRPRQFLLGRSRNGSLILPQLPGTTAHPVRNLVAP
jgi:hypothetical protein